MMSHVPRQAAKRPSTMPPWRLVLASVVVGLLLGVIPPPGFQAQHANAQTTATGTGGKTDKVGETAGNATPPETNRRPAREPYMLLRTLQAVQDSTAHGSHQALPMQSRLLSQINQQFMAAPASVWQMPQNARAAVSFALSGGSPAILHKLAKLDPPPAIDATILNGVTAYIDGDMEKARQILADVDPALLAPGLNGRIALVLSALHAQSDPPRAMRMLDLARLFLPGTLVDEGALRRQIFLAGQMSNRDKFRLLTVHYLHRYIDSVYMADFVQRFSTALVRMTMTGTPEDEQWLKDILAKLRPSDQLDVSLSVARQAVNRGKLRLASLSARHAMTITPRDSVAFERARLYDASAIVVEEQGFARGTEILKSINRQRLPEQDAALLDSALYLASHIRGMPAAPRAAETSAPNARTAQTSVPAPAGVQAPTVMRAPTGVQATPAGAPPLPQPGFEPNSALGDTMSRVRELIGESDTLIEEETGS